MLVERSYNKHIRTADETQWPLRRHGIGPITGRNEKAHPDSIGVGFSREARVKRYDSRSTPSVWRQMTKNQLASSITTTPATSVR